MALAADLEPQGQRVGLRLVGQHLEHGRPGLGGDGQHRADVLTVFTHACHHKGVSAPHKHVPADAHEWVSFDDPDEERTWLFDVTFLVSAWTCIFGQGCQGVLTGPAPELVQGCCSYGAHFTGKKDAGKVERAADDSRPTSGSSTSRASKGVVKKLADGDLGTRLVDGACIFLNRPGFPAGPGAPCTRRRRPRDGATSSSSPRCAGSSRCGGRTRRRPTAGSPRWSASGTAGTGARAARSSTGGAPRTPTAFVGHEPVYVSMRTELETMAGKKVYKRLAAYLDERTRPGRRSPCCPTRHSAADGRARSGPPRTPARRPTRPAGRPRRASRHCGAVPRISS